MGIYIYILCVRRNSFHFYLICTLQTVSGMSLKSALENLMKESSSSLRKVFSDGSLERKVGVAHCLYFMMIKWILHYSD